MHRYCIPTEHTHALRTQPLIHITLLSMPKSMQCTNTTVAIMDLLSLLQSDTDVLYAEIKTEIRNQTRMLVG